MNSDQKKDANTLGFMLESFNAAHSECSDSEGHSLVSNSDIFHIVESLWKDRFSDDLSEFNQTFNEIIKGEQQ
jgi:hypothetical protein